MAAATSAIDTIGHPGLTLALPVAASTKIYAGTLVAVDANGYAVPASDTASLKVVGRCEALADNSAGSAGDIRVTVARGSFWYANSGTDAVDANDRFKVCYVADDQTVRETGGTNSIKAGLVLDVDATKGVLVDTTVAQAL